MSADESVEGEAAQGFRAVGEGLEVLSRLLVFVVLVALNHRFPDRSGSVAGLGHSFVEGR